MKRIILVGILLNVLLVPVFAQEAAAPTVTVPAESPPPVVAEPGVVMPTDLLHILWKNNTATITGYSGSSKQVVIPEKITGLPVVAIADNAFSNKGLTSISIPNTVTSIGRRAFANNQLTNITIPDSVTSIGDEAFSGNNSEWPYDKTCSVIISDSVTTTIGYRAFANSCISSLTLGKGLISIAPSAFSDNNISSLSIPDSVQTIGENAFANNPITNLNTGNGLVSIGANAFSGNRLETLTIGQKLSSVGQYALMKPPVRESRYNNESYGYELTTVTIAANVTLDKDAIGNDFITVYNSTGKKAGTYTFISYGGIWNIIGWTTENNTGGVIITGYGGNETSVTIPSKWGNLPVVDLKASIDPNNSSRYKGIFSGSSVKSATISGSVSSISSYAFYRSSLSEVTIGSDVKSIDSNAFSANSNLKTITIAANVSCAENSFPGNFVEIYNKNNKGEGTYSYFDSSWALTSITIKGVTAITDNQYSKQHISKVTISSTVITIGKDAFSQNNLTSLVIPNSVTSIGDNAFANNQLASVSIGNKVTQIGSFAFSNNKLTDITIPGNVATIGEKAFTNNQLTSLRIDPGVTTISESAFANNKLTKVEIPKSVKSIANSAFVNNPITQIVIHANITLSNNTDTPAFPNNFDIFYYSNGSKAGTYEYLNNHWEYKGN